MWLPVFIDCVLYRNIFIACQQQQQKKTISDICPIGTCQYQNDPSIDISMEILWWCDGQDNIYFFFWKEFNISKKKFRRILILQCLFFLVDSYVNQKIIFKVNIIKELTLLLLCFILDDINEIMINDKMFQIKAKTKQIFIITHICVYSKYY
mgnify:CR=1 FL=1